MNNHNTFFNNLMHFVYRNDLRFHDIRTQATFVWAIVGLLIGERVNLSLWALWRPGQANLSSKQRQFSRWLHNSKVEPMTVYAPFIRHVLQEWAGETILLAFDTSQLWHRFVIVRVALVYRGRALPVGWTVLTSKSATVALERYRSVLQQVAGLLPSSSRVILLADRGFMDVKLMQLARDLGWHFRIRAKLSVWVYRATKKRRKIKALFPSPGGARFFKNVWLTEQRFGPVHLAVVYVGTPNGYEKWAIISDEPTSPETLNEYGRRFCIEENFLDDKSAGFQLESSHIRDEKALSCLCLILATTTIYLASTGTAIVETQRRRLVDTHWERGLSYLQIGWRWVKLSLNQGHRLLDFIWLCAEEDPEPAMASWKQFLKPDLHIQCIEWL